MTTKELIIDYVATIDTVLANIANKEKLAIIRSGLMSKLEAIRFKETPENDVLNTYLENICNYYNITPLQLKSRGQERELSDPRGVFWHIVYYEVYLPSNPSSGKKDGLTLKKLAIAGGRQNHATVLHGIAKINNFISTNKAFKKNYQNCLLHINGIIKDQLELKTT